ncbi:MAG: ATP-grasp domain-containing protein [Actinomycetota bacterium]
MDVALATCEAVRDLEKDERVFLDALKARGVEAEPAVWDDRSFDWTEPRLCLIRSVWDYYLRRDEFLAWLDSLPSSVQVWNPSDVIRWNSHKGYLRDLESRGVPIIPTEWFVPGDAPDLTAIARANGWEGLVVKPVVSAAAHRTHVFEPHAKSLAQEHLDTLLSDGEAMVQPFMDEVHDNGERSVIVIDGLITHAVRKTSVFDPTFVDEPPRIEISPPEEKLAHQALEAAGFDYLYARVDMVHDEDGAPRLMELEMFEPSLYFDAAQDAAERLADRVIVLLG